MARFARPRLYAACILLPLLAASTAQTQGAKYDPGADDKTIRIGTTAPLSGPVSAFAQIAKSAEAYFRKVNDEGGVNGRRIQMIIADDAYSPPKTVEQTRRLVESEEVLLIFGGVGTPTNSAVHKYLNDRKVPQLFLGPGAAKWDDPKNFPWTVGWQPTYRDEAIAYAKYIKASHANAKIGVLYQNDDYGKDYLKGLKDGLGAKAASMIVLEESYETSEPTIDNHIVKLKSTGADVFINITTPKFAAQATKKNAEIGWKPTHFLNNVSASVGSVIKPAGFENAQGIISAAYLKDTTDAQWANDAGMKAFLDFMAKYFPEGDKTDGGTVVGYGVAQTLVQVLKNCGDDLTRANVMKQAASLKDFRTEVLLPGIKINTSATDFAPISSLQLQRFKGERWELFGDVINAEAGG
jgi:branched-chain amino acid transport system substrate-binding protein